MLDLRLLTAAAAVMVALMSVALAEPTRDQTPVASQGSTDARPVHVRVIFPAPWEQNTPQTERPSK